MDPLVALAAETARRHGLDPALVCALVEQESAWDVRAYRFEPHLNEASYGLTQTLLSTARWMGYEGEGEGLYDPAQSLEYGCRFLAWLRDNVGPAPEQILGGYNAGPANWRDATDYVAAVRARLPAYESLFKEPTVTGRVLDVPYISQLEPNGIGYNNCGPAVGAMLAAYNGVITASREDFHRFADRMRDGVYDGDWDAGVYTDYPQIIAELARFGLASKRLNTWEDVFATIDAGQPVIVWCHNDLLEPRQYPAGGGWTAHHFIVLAGYDLTNFTVCDPLAYPDKRPGLYSGRSVRAAVAAITQGIEVYAMAVDGPEPGSPMPQPEPPPTPDPGLPPPPWDGIFQVMDKQIKDLREEVSVRTKERDAARSDAAGWQAESNYNERKLLTLLGWLYEREGKRPTLRKKIFDALLAAVPRRTT